MDNFMDKLAQRYNASEMIKANSEADAAEMQNLQEQVEAYEAVLQEMRKLNYKNTELTEKMYSLVDESIEKVRTLQIEASENGANTELISREMSDAVTGALNEALNNMDSTVARTISESLASALAQPTEEIKQNTVVAANVGSKVDSLKESSELIFASVEDVKTTVSLVSEASMDIASKIDTILEMTSNKDDASGAEVTLTPEIIEMIKAVNDKAAKLNDMIALVQATADQNRGILQTITLAEEANKESMALVSDAVIEIKTANEAMSADLKSVNEASAAELKTINETAIAELKSANEAAIAELKSANEVAVAELKSANEAATSESATDRNQIKAGLEAINTNVNSTNEKADRIVALLENDNNSVSFDEESKNYITNIWNSVEATRSAVSAMQSGASKTELSDEVKAMMIELASDSEEIKTSLRNVKSTTDDTKTSLKASFDSAIYGLKQDNKEIVEFIQRMNNNITAKQNDPELERKEEEARQREEDNKKALEERFKMNEDFIHKESVKVYRNVQAVINEKSDQQTIGLEAKVKTNTAKIGQTKVIAIVAAALSGLTLVCEVLQIFGVL